MARVALVLSPLLLLAVPAGAQPLIPPVNYTELQFPVCVVKGDRLEAVYVAETVTDSGRDTVLARVTPARRFADAYPPGAAYALHHVWSREKAPVQFRRRSYVPVGEPRHIGIGEVRRTEATFWGVRIYVENREGAVPRRIAVPLRPGCVFQMYQLDPRARGERGKAPRGRLAGRHEAPAMRVSRDRARGGPGAKGIPKEPPPGPPSRDTVAAAEGSALGSRGNGAASRTPAPGQ